MEICTANAYYIIIGSFVRGLISAINIDRASQFLVLIVFVNLFVVLDASGFASKGETYDPEFIGIDMESDDIVESAVELTEAEYLIAIQDDCIVHLRRNLGRVRYGDKLVTISASLSYRQQDK